MKNSKHFISRLHGLIVLSLHVNYTEGNTKHTIFNHFQSHQFFSVKIECFFYLSNTFMFSEKLREGQQSFRNLMSAKQLNAEKLTLVDRLVSTPHSNPRTKICVLKNKQTTKNF